MSLRAFVVTFLFLLPKVFGQQSEVCGLIASSISSASEVFYPGSDGYAKDIRHTFDTSTINSTCSVEPGTAEDVAVILQILGSTRTNFAVKGGGHDFNGNCSSTTGVQIAMSRFSDVIYNADNQTAILGAGLIWDEVYTRLEPFGVNVPGGRVSGIGVAGFTLGGGFSWQASQHGLAVDYVLQFELVLPNGHIITVSENSYPDLFWGLRGGLNNFGIVTRFTFKTFPQGKVWGGFLGWAEADNNKATTALQKFTSNQTDPRASVIQGVGYTQDTVIGWGMLFYDGPVPPPGLFDDFLTIPLFQNDTSTSSYAELILRYGGTGTGGFRGAFTSVSVPKVSTKVMNAFVNQTKSLGTRLSPLSLHALGYAFEPFLSTPFQQARVPSAWPPSRDRQLYPSAIGIQWTNSSADETMRAAMRESTEFLKSVLATEENEPLPLYPNYAMPGTPLEEMYGTNVERLRELKKAVDPLNVMDLTVLPCNTFILPSRSSSATQPQAPPSVP